MATVTVNMTEPKPVVESITVELTLTEAAYVTALLGNGNAWETYMRAGIAKTEQPTDAYFRLHSAVVEAGGAALCAKLARAAEDWDAYGRRA